MRFVGNCLSGDPVPGQTGGMSSSEKDTAAASDPAATDQPDDLKAKFRAALAKKHGADGVSGNPHAQGGSMAPHTNDKVTRQFRRKSGG